jgi:trimeric autotransporter adhesin
MPNKFESQLNTVVPTGTDIVTGLQSGANVNYTTDSIAARATLNGAATAAALSAHIGDTSNPHAVTLAQVGGAPVGAKYIVQTADSTLTNEQALGALATGLLKNTTATGVLSTAIGDTDYTLPATFNAHTARTDNPHSVTIGQVSPLTTRGDLLTRDASAHKRLALGSVGTFLNSDGTDALWRALLATDIPGLDTSKLTTGQLALARGGTGADLSATGGANQIVKQSSAGGVLTVGALVAADIPSLDTSKIATGQLSPARGGTGVDNGTNALIVPASGTAALGTGTTGRMTEWGGTNTLQASSLVKSGSNLLTLNVDADQTWSALGNTLAFGSSAGAANSAANSWVALGSNAAPANIDGTDWIAIGAFAAYRNVHGNSWTAIGGGAANNNTGSGFFTAVGSLAGYSNTSGNSWTAIGTSAGQSNTAGSGWVAIGVNAATSSDTGKEFTAIGTRAGQANIDGWWWTAIGAEAGYSNTHGDYWIAIGRQAGYSNVSGSRNIFIGHQAGYSETGSDRLYIEPSNSSSPLIYGEFDNDLLRVNGTLELTLISTPGSPASTQVRLFARDNGSGKQQYCVKFQDGTVAVIATQP